MKELGKNVDFQLGMIYGYARAKTEEIINDSESYAHLIGYERQVAFDYVLNEILSEVAKNYENRKRNP